MRCLDVLASYLRLAGGGGSSAAASAPEGAVSGAFLAALLEQVVAELERWIRSDAVARAARFEGRRDVV